jgi:hypothetical protein
MVLDTGSSRLAALEKNSPLLLPSTPNRVSALEKENKAVEEVETVQRSSKWGRGEEGGEWELWGESVIGFMCGWALVDGLLHFLAFNLQKQENGLLHLGFGLWSMIWMNGLLHFLAIFLPQSKTSILWSFIQITIRSSLFSTGTRNLYHITWILRNCMVSALLKMAMWLLPLTYPVSWSHRFLPPNTEVVVSGGLLCMFNKSLIIQVLGKLAVWVNLLELGGAKLDYMSLGDLV